MAHKGKAKRHEHEHASRHEADFRLKARRNRLIGQWAAETLGLPADQHQAYAKEVIASDLEEPGDEDIIRKVLADFSKRGVSLSREELLKKLSGFTAEAEAQLTNS